jgi:hypothetical protein
MITIYDANQYGLPLIGFLSGYCNTYILNFFLTSMLAFYQISIIKYSYQLQPSKFIVFYAFGNTFNSLNFEPFLYGSLLGITIAISITTENQEWLVEYLGLVNTQVKDKIEKKKVILNNYIESTNNNKTVGIIKNISNNIWFYTYKYFNNIFKTVKTLIHFNIQNEHEKDLAEETEIDLKDDSDNSSTSNNNNMWNYISLSDSISSTDSIYKSEGLSNIFNENEIINENLNLNLNYVI